MAGQLHTKTEKEHIARVFKTLDISGNGKISKEELLDGFEIYSPDM
jgi:Ca2+-binding EF-hand superfamily protein